MRRLAVSLMAVVLVASAASGGDGDGPKAPTPRTGPAPGRFVVDVRAPSKVPEGAKPVVALLLSPKKDAKRFSEELGRVLRERGFHVWICQAPKDGWDAPTADALLAGAVRNVGRDPKHKGAAVLLVAASDAGRCARTAIDRFSGRLAGAVLISVAPLERSPVGIDLWAPRGEAWKVPLWCVVGTDPKDAAQILLMWRQIASVAPEGSLLTIDVRLGQGGAGATFRRTGPSANGLVRSFGAGGPRPARTARPSRSGIATKSPPAAC
ncbi:MAG TPA: hypothetical protein VMZ50_01785 [Phycisphaerae bacterium]|nr:hypothetical protein [Phycisphaerae bacterium]